jgi:hypothetical protein
MYAELPNQSVKTEGARSLAHRDTAGAGRTAILFQHCRPRVK